MYNRVKTREEMMILIYQYEIHNDLSFEIEEKMNKIKREKDKLYANELIEYFKKNKESIDELINLSCDNWNTLTIGKIDLSILRLALSEVLMKNSIAYEVSINEALELAKKFSTDNSPAFIHAVLGKAIEKINENN